MSSEISNHTGYGKEVLFQKNQILDQRYQILNPIGEGGLGLVYLAYDLHMETYVVVKQVAKTGGVLPPRHEVDTLKTLSNSNLPRVYDCLSVGNYLFTVMDYVEGEDLKCKIEKGVIFSVEDLIHWYRQLTDVLVYLEKKHIVHSDIKPGNIIITPENDAMLIDFNISISNRNRRVVGISMDYASPEQMNGLYSMQEGSDGDLALDTRSDIYSLGATFYELISHAKPSPMYYVRPLLEMNLPVPEVFCGIVDTAMQKDPEARYQTASEMKRQLDNMWKKQTHYRTYLAVQILVIVISTGLLSSGLYLTIHGLKEKTRVNFNAAYNDAVIEINNQNYTEAEKDCVAFLNTYENMLKKEPEKKAEILKGLGDMYLHQENYESACTYYQQAADLITDKADTLVLDCYTAMVQAYLLDDNSGMAEYMLIKAELDGVSGTSLKLLNVQVESLEGQESACQEDAQQLLDECDSRDVCARACLAAAEGSDSEETQLDWYEKSLDYMDEPELYRQAGSKLLELSSVSPDVNIADDALTCAVSCYKALVVRSDTTINDYYNLATAYRLQGNYDASLQTLSDLENSRIQGMDAGVLSMYRAFTYADKNDSVKAMAMIRSALSEVTEDDVSEAQWEHLQELKQQYGL